MKKQVTITRTQLPMRSADRANKSVYVFNPWKEGLLRSGTVRRVTHIRPNLVQKLVKLYDNHAIYHYSGMIVLRAVACEL